MTKKEAIDWIKANPNKEFSIRFIKNDGSPRFMKALFGHDDGTLTKNPIKPAKPPKPGIVIVYDVTKGEYRSFHEDKLFSIDIGDEKGMQSISDYKAEFQ